VLVLLHLGRGITHLYVPLNKFKFKLLGGVGIGLGIGAAIQSVLLNIKSLCNRKLIF